MKELTWELREKAPAISGRVVGHCLRQISEQLLLPQLHYHVNPGEKTEPARAQQWAGSIWSCRVLE